MKIKIVSITLVIGMLSAMVAPAVAQIGKFVPTLLSSDSNPVPSDVTISTGAADVTVTSGANADRETKPVAIIGKSNDRIAPRIIDVVDVSVSPTEAIIAWTTDELADSRIDYGTTLNYGLQAALGVSLALVHSSTLLGLMPGTTYFYCIRSEDAAGNGSSSCGHSLTTPHKPIVVEVRPPIISAITISHVTPKTAKIIWNTDEIADSQVEYGLTDGYGQITKMDLALSATHSAELSNLLPNTQYHFRVKSGNHAGHEVISGDEHFTTAALKSSEVRSSNLADTVGPIISAIAASTVTATGATISWTTSKPTESRVEYGESTEYGNLTPLGSSLDLSHSKSLSGLSSYTRYHYRIRSRDSTGNVIFSEDHEFTTLSVPLVLDSAPVISNVSVILVSANSATIAWTTNEMANSQIEYGLSSAYGEKSEVNLAYTESHQETIDGLSPNTTYHFRVKSKDSIGNFSFAEDLMFKTAEALDVKTPQAVQDLTVKNVNQTSVTLVWTVPTDASGILRYDIRYATHPLTADNFDGAKSVHDTVLYSDQVEKSGTSHQYTVVGLTPDTTYHFALKAFDSNDRTSAISNVATASTLFALVIGAASHITSPVSNSGVGLTGSISEISSGTASGGTPVAPSYTSSNGAKYKIVDTIAPGQVKYLKAQSLDSQIMFFWTNPIDTDFLRVRILRKANSYPRTPTDGTIIYEGGSETFSDGKALFTDTGLVNSKTYYYSFYTYDEIPNFSAPVQLSVAPRVGNRHSEFVIIPAFLPAVPSFILSRNLSYGSRSHDVKHVQELLAADPTLYPAGLVTGYYGPLTRRAIIKLQKRYGLAQNGNIDRATRGKIIELSKFYQIIETPLESKTFVLARDLYRGIMGNDVKYLQRFLQDRGFYPRGLITGVFDLSTQNAVLQLQRQYRIIPATGYVGFRTKSKIQELVGR